ncbi:Os09g0509450 [Oryza sativa Japonica Group]|uniref:Os09g0509450 protein n=1 Tax=Oryza sativa subsp. japonica TaxID=39947 RepID=A0A0N7KR33_ORYSJ|nr:hypothetical protein EE612_048851 [Oryza sativa]BAT08898.1 Os09g0509450 [Oryza sativa Japonica Group]
MEASELGERSYHQSHSGQQGNRQYSDCLFHRNSDQIKEIPQKSQLTTFVQEGDQYSEYIQCVGIQRQIPGPSFEIFYLNSS